MQDNLILVEPCFKNYDAVISIGDSCYTGKYLKKYVKSMGSVFDYMGSPIWGIVDVITNNWEKLFVKEKYILLELYNPKTNNLCYNNLKHPFIVHSDYNLTVAHDANRLTDITPEFFSKLKERIKRFEEYCRTAKKILFIRIQRNANHLIAKDYPDERSEMEMLPIFIDLIRTKYCRNQVSLIFINSEKDGWNEDKTILFVKTNTLNFMFSGADGIHKLFIEKNVYSQF